MKPLSIAMSSLVVGFLVFISSRALADIPPHTIIELTPGDAVAGDKFGYPLFSKGDLLVVGAPGVHAPDCIEIDPFDPICNIGALYVFRNIGGTWVQEAKLFVSEPQAGAISSARLAVDKNTIVVATHNFPGDGEAFVFSYVNGTWIEQAKLTASSSGIDFVEAFGVSIDMDGDTIVIGDSYADSALSSNTGAVYVFVRSGQTWVEQAKLTASDGQLADFLGESVAVVGDLVVAGAHGVSVLPDHIDCGAAYVFRRTGNTWSQIGKLLADEPQRGPFFGEWVDMDVNTIVVGSPGWDGPNPEDEFQGAVYVFQTMDGGNSWSQTQKLGPSEATDIPKFGAPVSLIGDRLMVGAFGGNSGAFQFVDVFQDMAGTFALSYSISPPLWLLNHYQMSGGDSLWDGPAGDDQGRLLIYQFDCLIDSACSPDANVCTCSKCVVTTCEQQAHAFADTNCDGNASVNLDDLLCTIQGFADTGACPSADITDSLAPGACAPDGRIDLDDILGVIAAFGGVDPCGCSL